MAINISNFGIGSVVNKALKQFVSSDSERERQEQEGERAGRTISGAIDNINRRRRRRNRDSWNQFIGKNVVKEVTRKRTPALERYFENYAGDAPELIFVAEYMVDDERIGSLVCWEKYLDSTHYEVFKRNTFQSNSKFERVLFLDSKNLEEETKNFMTYVKDTLGFRELNEDNVFIVLDHSMKEDRIYEYTVRASRFPSAAEDVDFDIILKSRDRLNTTRVTNRSRNTVFDLAGAVLGSEDLGWMVSLSNDPLFFFGKEPLERSVASFLAEGSEETAFSVNVPKNTNEIFCMIAESISFFGVRPTFRNLLRKLKGLSDEFLKTSVQSLDEVNGMFSYDFFRERIKKQVPVFNLLLNIVESGDPISTKRLSALSINVPNNVGKELVTSLEGITKVIKFINDTFIAILHSQDSEIAGKILEISRDINVNRARTAENIFNVAISESPFAPVRRPRSQSSSSTSTNNASSGTATRRGRGVKLL